MTDYDKSRLEAEATLHLRCAGYLHKNVEEEMRRHRRLPIQTTFRQKSAIFNAYYNYAFGAQGDIWALGQRFGKPEAEKFDREAEIIAYYINQQNETLKGNYQK